MARLAARDAHCLAAASTRKVGRAHSPRARSVASSVAAQATVSAPSSAATMIGSIFKV
jgi:hypothetical protein